MKRHIIFTAIALSITTILNAQTTIEYQDFQSEVLEYSNTIKQSKSQSEAMKQAMKATKTAFYPAIDAAGNFQYRINDYSMDFGGIAIPMRNESYATEIGVIQPIYAGGKIKNTYEASKIQNEMAERGVDLTIDNIIFAAESAYWGTAAQQAMYRTMCQYVDIIENLSTLLQTKFDDGLISKTELIQMQTRLTDAKLQRSNSKQAYEVAKQNMNILRGHEAMAELMLGDSILIKDRDVMRQYIPAEEAFESRPDYAISQLSIDHQSRQIKIAAASYNPTLAIGAKETWGTQMLNIDGSSMFNSNVYLSLKVPIFHGGARRKAVAAQRALLSTQEFAHKELEDQISREVASAWTNVQENMQQIKIAEENRLLAEENLSLNTFSYTEGKLPILDVLSAQIAWIQSYTSLIQSYYKEKISLATYNKAVGYRSY